ncbi:TATA-binding protein-associated phosphoprotein, putative [Entamoeba invadens IP1]|uniref:TATA-binding protein-associated phosphoprotein, putative n=1 Tax=Entamoeba invadens IP1 TaxID=370355 RepID=A0A0A1UDJ3_ENTIV|nr:TATA-binding protein-associated phosphoprotein, putative [Entamoeba invadens IP1]ELP94626.1 TATA-binding protein-associated phosphoprotein, putative [Entamoeba invadens IP1]|eukprot:XP_004261397.1 TATA-binding protein-associated phosphoprotein, putative [Entamoeba invadens IP1]
MADEHFLPKTSINKLIKENISPSFRVSSDLRDVIADCGVEFIHILAAESKDVAGSANRKTLNTDHVIKALNNLELTGYIDELKGLIDEQAKNIAKKPVDPELTQEEKIKRQQESEQRALEKLNKQYGSEQVKTFMTSLQKPTDQGPSFDIPH